MANDQSHKLSEVLDQLEAAAHGHSIAVREVVEKLGQRSFTSLILIFALVWLTLTAEQRWGSVLDRKRTSSARKSAFLTATDALSDRKFGDTFRNDR
jgi:hypothetical protein